MIQVNIPDRSPRTLSTSKRWAEIRHDPPNLDSYMYMTNMLVEMLKYKIFLNLKKYQPGRKQIAFEGQKT